MTSSKYEYPNVDFGLVSPYIYIFITVMAFLMRKLSVGCTLTDSGNCENMFAAFMCFGPQFPHTY